MDEFAKPMLVLRTGSKTTDQDAYAAIEEDDLETEYFPVKGYYNKVMALVCTVNNLVYDIDGALDDGTNSPDQWIDLVTDQALNVGNTKWGNTEPWDYIRVRVKPAVAATHGKLQADLRGSTL